MKRPLHIVAPSYVSATVGGSGTAFVEITRELLRLERNVRIYLNKTAAEQLQEFSDAVVVVPTRPMTTPWRKALSLLELELPGRLRIPRDEVCWFPLGMVVPQTFRGRGVATLYDTLQRDLPACVPPLERVYRAMKIPLAVRKTHVVTSSKFSAERLKHYYGASAEVIPLAPIALPPPDASTVPSADFVFYPANAWPHKNHRFLLQLWRQFPELRALTLVFTLGGGMGSLAPDIAAARADGVHIVVTSWQSPAQLAGLYRAAFCTVFPSLYEGFGLPVQEALLCECPVLMSDKGSLPETVVPGYPYSLPLIAERWVDAILSRPRLKMPSPATYLPAYNWVDCASRYLDRFRGLST